ncbi:uncharacterized protein J3R85_003085 [Psidium guajava]|nr:uncharacterized protein J3R85_003085 [Psidium guajava]
MLIANVGSISHTEKSQKRMNIWMQIIRDIRLTQQNYPSWVSNMPLELEIILLKSSRMIIRPYQDQSRYY